MATSTRLTLDTLAAAHVALAEAATVAVTAINTQVAGIESTLGRTIVGMADLAGTVAEVRKDVTALRYAADNKSGTSTPHAMARETAPKPRKNPRTVSDPTGNDAASSARLDSLMAEWANVKPKSPKYDGVVRKYAAVNALRANGVSKPMIHGWIRSGTLLEHAAEHPANGAQTATTRQSGKVASPVAKPRQTAAHTAELVAADASSYALDIPGYVITVRSVR